MDETAFGGRKYHRGKWVRETGPLWALTFVEVQGSKSLYFDMVFLDQSRRDAAWIGAEVRKRFNPNIPGAVMTSDMWRAYDSVAEECGLTHRTVNHSVEFVAQDGTHTNNVEGNKVLSILLVETQICFRTQKTKFVIQKCLSAQLYQISMKTTWWLII